MPRWLPGGTAEGDVPKALQGAMVEMLEAGRPVREWGAFVSYGSY